MIQQGSSLNKMVKEGLLFDNVVIPSDNFNFKKYRQNRIRADGKMFTQDDAAKMLQLADAQVISKFERNELRPDNRTYSLFLLATDNHPFYDLENKSDDLTKPENLIIEPPTDPESIKSAREAIAGLQQNQISYLLGLHLKVFGKYESSNANPKNRRSPTAHTWTLFLLITNQHPYYKLSPKKENTNV